MALSLRDMALAVFAAFIWGATFPVSAFALADTPPVFFTFLRFLCAAGFAIVIPKPALSWTRLIALGCLLGIGQYGLMFVAMSQGLPAGLAAVLVHTQAIFTVLLAMMLLGDRPTRSAARAMMVAALGLGCLLLDRMQVGAVSGFVLMICAALSAAAGNIVLKTASQVEMSRVAVWMSFAPLIPLLVLSLVLEGNGSLGDLVFGITWITILAVLYSGACATVFAYAIWGRLLVTYSAAHIAPYFLLVPMFGLGLSALVLGEQMTGLQIVGSTLILLGLVLSILGTDRGVAP